MHTRNKKTYKISKELDQLLKQCEKHTSVALKNNQNDNIAPFQQPIIEQQYLISNNNMSEYLQSGKVKKKNSLYKSKDKKCQNQKMRKNKTFANLKVVEIQKIKNHLETSLSIKAKSVRSLSKMRNNRDQSNLNENNKNKKTKITLIKPRNAKNKIKTVDKNNNPHQKIQGWAFPQSPFKCCKQNADLFGSPKQSSKFYPQFNKQVNKTLQFQLQTNESIAKQKQKQKHAFLKNLKLKHTKANKIRKKSQLRKSNQLQLKGGDGITIFIEDNSVDENKKQQQFNDSCVRTQKYQSNSFKKFVSSRESSPTKNVIINIKNIVCEEKEMQNKSFRVNHYGFIPKTQTRVMSARTSAKKNKIYKTCQNQQLKYSYEQTRFITIQSSLSYEEDNKTQKIKERVKTHQNFHVKNKNNQPTLVAHLKNSKNDNFTINNKNISPIKVEQSIIFGRKCEARFSNSQTPKSKSSIKNYEFPINYSEQKQKPTKSNKILGWQLRITERGGKAFNKLTNLLKKQQKGTIFLPCQQEIETKNSTKKLIKNKR